jgi:hypothetical protein
VQGVFGLADGSTSISEYPSGIVVLDCPACSREFRYLKWLLVSVFGADLTLEQLRDRFTVDCPRWRDPALGKCAMRLPG